MNFIEDAKNVVFDEAAHTYKIGDKELISVTKFISLFSNKFDPDGAILSKKALEKGVSEKQLKKEWEAKGEKSRNFGTEFHENLEHYFRTGKIKKNKHTEAIKNFSESFKFRGQIFPETRIHDELIGICGTADIVQIIDDKMVQIHDAKTNLKEPSHFAFGKRMKEPISHVADSKLNSYFLQISLYLYLLSSKYGYEIGENNFIFWLNRKKNQLEKIPVELKINEVISMISHYTFNKNIITEPPKEIEPTKPEEKEPEWIE